MVDLEPHLAALLAREAVPVCPKCGVLAVLTRALEAAGEAIAKHAGGRAVVQQAIESAWERGRGRAEIHLESGADLPAVRGLSCPTCGAVHGPRRPHLAGAGAARRASFSFS